MSLLSVSDSKYLSETTLRDSQLRSFLYTGEFSDVTIICDGHEFHMHKVLLLSKKSHFFESILRGSFAEAHSSRIEIKDQEPAIVARMLSWFYVDTIIRDLHDCPLNFSSFEDAYTRAIRGSKSSYDLWCCKLGVAMYAIASQFGIPGLQQDACDLFEKEFGESGIFSCSIWDTCSDDDVEDLIRSVYTTTSEIEHGLRDFVVKDILQLRQCDPKFGCKIDKLVRSSPGLAMDLARCFLVTETGKPQKLARPCSDPQSDQCKGRDH